MKRWMWYILCAVIILLILWILRININLGYGGFSLTQGLFR